MIVIVDWRHRILVSVQLDLDRAFDEFRIYLTWALDSDVIRYCFITLCTPTRVVLHLYRQMDSWNPFYEPRQCSKSVTTLAGGLKPQFPYHGRS